MHLRSLFLIPALLGSIVHAEEEPWGARMELTSEMAVIAAGSPFEVGIRVHHREGFHSYWKSPGVVGFATKVEWELPEGFTAGPLVWPTPELVDMVGHAAHGYHRDVLLTTTITPPAKLTGEKVNLKARIAWMACADACHPGDGVYSLTLPVGDEATPCPDNAPEFEASRNGQPAPLAGWSAELMTEVDAREIILRLSPTEQPAPLLESPYFFSEDGQIADGTPTVSTGADGVLIYTFQRAEFGPKGAKGLPGLIAYGPEGERSHGTISP